METKQSHFPTIYNLILWMSLNCYVLSWEWLSSGPRSSLTLAETWAPYHMGLSIGLLTTWHLASFWEQQIQDRRRVREEEKREVTVFSRPNLRSDSPSLLLVFFFFSLAISHQVQPTLEERGFHSAGTPDGIDHWGPSQMLLQVLSWVNGSLKCSYFIKNQIYYYSLTETNNFIIDSRVYYALGAILHVAHILTHYMLTLILVTTL